MQFPKTLLKLDADNRGYVWTIPAIIKIIAVVGLTFGLITVATQWKAFEPILKVVLEIIFVYLPTIIGTIVTLLAFIIFNFPIVLMLAEMCVIGLSISNSQGNLALTIILFARYNLNFFNFLWKLSVGFLHLLMDFVKMVKPAG